MPSSASVASATNLSRVDDILSFHSKTTSPTKGPPPGKDRSLVLGAVALVYASWEAYIERVAVEVTTYLASTLPPAAVPSTARACISNAAVPWDLVGDGWRTRWTEVVTRLAIGSGPNDFGLNTAGPRQVVHLFEAVGLSPFDKVSWQKMNTASVKKKLASLVRDRGEIVHTGVAPTGIGLNTARGYRLFIEQLIARVDSSLGSQATGLAGASPW